MADPAFHTPLPADDYDLLPPPVTRSMLGSGVDSPRESYTAPSTVASGAYPPHSSVALFESRDSNIGKAQEKEELDPSFEKQPLTRSRKPLWFLSALIALVVVVLAVILPVYFVVIRTKHNNNNNSASSQAPQSAAPTISSGGNPSPTTGATLFGDGTVVTAADGTTFVYSNPFGGQFVSDPSNPFNNAARPQSWVPALNETWTYGKDAIRGVNFGGWFVLEPFIVPSLFERYQTAPFQAHDEWTLSQAMAADQSPGGGLSQLEKHYQTFITEKDFAEVVSAGLSWIRLPVPYWAIEKWDGEPFLEKVAWKYILQAFAWARKYGLRIFLDLHTVPGSQNGYNHSGKQGQVNFLNGVMGLANAERTLGYIRIITEFISQPEYRNLIPMLGIVNEALLGVIGKESLLSFYLRAHDMVRSITGTGAGNGPYLVIHDGFRSVDSWAGDFQGSDRIALDTHPYFAFSGSANIQPLADYIPMPCNGWAPGINNSQRAFGVTVGGEFSSAVNDCGLWVRGVGGQASYGGDCREWEDVTTWDQAKKDGLLAFALTSMDALQNYFYWTWKIGNSTTTNSVLAPLWSYKLGLENGYIPKDPRQAYGACASLGITPNAPFQGSYLPWQTGGSGAGTIAPSISSQSPWPPLSMAGVDVPVALLPTYTSTGTVVTLPVQTFTLASAHGKTSTISGGDGWLDRQDTAGGVTVVAGCTYPDPWNAETALPPTAACTGVAGKREPLEPRITPPPV